MTTATMQTNQGTIEIELYDEDAPKTVDNFKKLAGDGFYDGVIFHRVIPDFMIQGGDPTGTGSGGPGYQFEDEANDHGVERGVLAMANAGPNTNGSQFFIVTADACPWLNGKHTVFGRVTGGMDVVDAISQVETGRGDRPRDEIRIESIALVPLTEEPQRERSDGRAFARTAETVHRGLMAGRRRYRGFKPELPPVHRGARRESRRAVR